MHIIKWAERQNDEENTSLCLKKKYKMKWNTKKHDKNEWCVTIYNYKYRARMYTTMETTSIQLDSRFSLHLLCERRTRRKKNKFRCLVRFLVSFYLAVLLFAMQYGYDVIWWYEITLHHSWKCTFCFVVALWSRHICFPWNADELFHCLLFSFFKIFTTDEVLSILYYRCCPFFHLLFFH